MNIHKVMNEKLKGLPEMFKNSSAIEDVNLRETVTEIHQAYFNDDLELFNERINDLLTGQRNNENRLQELLF